MNCSPIKLASYLPLISPIVDLYNHLPKVSEVAKDAFKMYEQSLKQTGINGFAAKVLLLTPFPFLLALLCRQAPKPEVEMVNQQ
jgi:hypothetical protein